MRKWSLIIISMKCKNNKCTYSQRNIYDLCDLEFIMILIGKPKSCETRCQKQAGMYFLVN